MSSSPQIPRSTSSRALKEISRSKAYHAKEARQGVLRGDFGILKDEDGNLNVSLWKSPTWTINVFVSSTFTDTHRERNFLMLELMPRLRNMGREHGVELTFVDMRWGVVDENTMDHLTWIACEQEIERCRNSSMDIFFLSLQV